ncbi:LacI family DNA-binding transcriptional regulator [Kribbella solani]|uniref:LacI family DNA-binding transcriptional regulator n=1 Tax=Kribbella solani TaxID=236067 RepID=UPI0029B81590|nr:LacI family DNA-binding transcriptional regulator [Kribbella solani]MDX2968720.1 LacI family DNA-binding transcriptional regulator [Kribbella solani]
MPDKATRLTQRDIARLANVSQTTVSLVLNNRSDATARIPAETRDRVLKVIRETGYQADPLARRMLKQRNQILGVFTYESVFPSASGDFYHPFLAGIEDCAERLGLDLLLFTSAPVNEGHRRIFHENNRLRIADGCLLLGRDVPHDELARLIAEDYPFVSVGRRDDAGGPVPYVGADYTAATEAIVQQARSLGHRHVAYAGPGATLHDLTASDHLAESSADRIHGFHQAAGPRALTLTTGPRPAALPDDHSSSGNAGATPPDSWAGELLDTLLDRHITAVFVEERADAIALLAAASARGIDVPADLSVIALGDSTRPVATEVDFSGFHIPRRAMGLRAVELLEAILSGTTTPHQVLLPCELTTGTTLTPPSKGH